MLLELDNTARVCFDSCEQKYYLRHVLDLVTLEPQNMAPYFGIAIHKGVQAFYEKKSRDNVMKAFGDAYAKWFDEKDDERTPANGMIILDEYIRRWREDYLKTVRLEIGHSILVEGEGVEVEYKMRIDRVADWNGEVVLEDWKTSKYVGSSFTIIKPNNQFVGYSLGVRDLMGVNPTFFLTTIGTYVKKRGAKNQPLKEGEERVEIVRDNVKFGEEDFKEFRRGVISTAKRIMQCKAEDYWPKRTHSCSSFQGCEYLPLCKAEKGVWRSMKETFYKEEKWRAYD